MMSTLDAVPSKEDILAMLDALPTRKDIMSTLGGLPNRQEVAEMLRHLTVRSEGYVLGGIGTFATGILTGAALAVLFAPKRGAELRQEIGARVRGLGDKIAKTDHRASEGR
jgi:YtxH-like protein